MLLYIHDYAMIVDIHEHAYRESSVPSLGRYVYVTDSKSGLILGLDQLIHCFFWLFVSKDIQISFCFIGKFGEKKVKSNKIVYIPCLFLY